MSTLPEESALPHKLDIDSTIMTLKAMGEFTGLTEDGKVKFTLYPVGIENPTECEEVVAPVSEESMETILRHFQKQTN